MSTYNSVAMATATGGADHFQEMVAFFRDQLSHPLADKLLMDLYALEVDLRTQRSKFEGQREAREISDSEYVRKLNAATKAWLDSSRKLLGESDFVAVYGSVGYAPEQMIQSTSFGV